MKAKIVLNQALTQDRYGLHFDKGEAYTENEYLIKKLKTKGVKVEIVQEEETEKALENMTIKELTKVAAEKGFAVPKNSKKADIIKLLDESSEETVESDTKVDENTEETQEENSTESSEETQEETEKVTEKVQEEVTEETQEENSEE